MAYYTDQFFAMDPGNPPASGTSLTMQNLSILDRNNNNYLTAGDRDMINGDRITDVWDGDQITVIDNVTGQQVTITGVTFYTRSGATYFTPTDGSKLHDSTFVSSTYVNQSTGVPIGDLGPPCFTAGTLIRTMAGLRPVEALQPGDLIATRDHGPRPLRWIGRRRTPGTGRFAPIRFAEGVIGNDRALLVSPQHRMLITGWQAELLFGENEVLAAARHLINGTTIVQCPRRRVDYVHLLFDRHEIVEAEGVPSESFHPGDYMMSGDTELRDEIVTLFPELANLRAAPGWEAARCVLKAHEAQLLHAA